MFIRAAQLAIFAFLGSVSLCFADPIELSRSELRKISAGAKLIDLASVWGTLSDETGGELLNVRAFESDGVFYRVLMKMPDGRLTVAIIDALSGEMIPANSGVTQEIMQAAKTKKGRPAVSKAAVAGNGNNGSNGNSGNSGNNGNSGGNGNSGNNGNSGGKGKNK